MFFFFFFFFLGGGGGGGFKQLVRPCVLMKSIETYLVYFNWQPKWPSWISNTTHRKYRYR